MAEEFQASNWWKSSKSGGFDGSSPEESNISCSTTITDVKGASFAWPGGSSTPSPMDSAAFALSSPTTDWSQTLLGSSSGRAESSIQAILQDDLSSRPPAFSLSMDAGESSSSLQIKDLNHPFFFNNSALPFVGFPLPPPPSSSSMLQFLFEPDSRNQQSLFNTQQLVNYHQQPDAMINHLQFTNNTPFWNASGSSSQLPFDLIMKNTDQRGREKKSSSEPAMTKRPRIDPPSPLTTFKVRKEKLGDRITALQQLVSPFGKTDTASVLHEAIEYIKFLHEQVSVLTTPYLKNGQPMQQHQQSADQLVDREVQNQNLRSRGLCLVPISSTYPMASETTADYWTPTFGGTYR